MIFGRRGCPPPLKTLLPSISLFPLALVYQIQLRHYNIVTICTSIFMIFNIGYSFENHNPNTSKNKHQHTSYSLSWPSSYAAHEHIERIITPHQRPVRLRLPTKKLHCRHLAVWLITRRCTFSRRTHCRRCRALYACRLFASSTREGPSRKRPSPFLIWGGSRQWSI